MSLLLALFSIGLGASLVKEVAKDATKVPARSRIQENSKKGFFNIEENFEDILYICDVKRKKFGNSSVPVLPYTGYEKCLDYIRNHHLTCKADEQRFITHYRKVLSKEVASRQKEFDNHYNKVELGVRALMNSSEYEVVRFEHTNAFVDQKDVEMKVNDICNKTIFGKFVIGEVKLKQSNAVVREIWSLKIPISMKCSLEEIYMASAQRCGYIY